MNNNPQTIHWAVHIYKKNTRSIFYHMYDKLNGTSKPLKKKNPKKSVVAARLIVRAEYVAVKKQIGSVAGPTVGAQLINVKTNHPRTTKRTTSLRLRLSR